MRVDPSGIPFILIAAAPAVLLAVVGRPAWAAGLVVLPIVMALFFRDPNRTPPSGPALVVAPADGRVMFAGLGRTGETPAGEWLQVTIFLSVFDVHINRAPAGGRVTQLDFVPGRLDRKSVV